MGKYRVGLNAHLLSLAPNYRGAGINQYIYNLLSWLPVVDTQGYYVAFLGEKAADFKGVKLRFSRLPTVKPVIRILWEQTVQPLALVKEGIEILHGMAFVGPLLAPCPFLVTIYDLSFLLFPESFKTWNRLYLSVFTRISARRADLVIAISENTKKDLVRLFDVPGVKVAVTYCGCDKSMRPLPRPEVEAFRESRSLPERFILFLGTLEPRKNLVRLVEAFALLKRKDVKLVLAGGKGWGYEPIFARVEELGLQERVLFPGFIPSEEKVYWYNAAEIFVYPSLYEGFGLPPLEAMACGTPVIASNAASLPEVVGDAGILIDAQDTNALAEALDFLLDHPEEREALKEKGLRRSREFSWEKTARETSELYRRVIYRRR
ncbi:MAG: glycosyltransferase family 1 protein [Chloroflexi bacterium]|nr:MAG: glycosyltransferase family 1 protein [Chloroflexota bacterium]